MTNSTLRFFAAFGLWAASTFSAAGEERIVWQIGQPDKSYAEFAIARNYPVFHERFGKQPLVFETGKSDPARDWPFIQPGPVDAWAGHREHPFTIRFALAEEPRGLFVLRVALVDAHSGSTPALRLSVGGQTGQFPLQPGGGDASLSDPAAGRPQAIEIPLPASLFRQGTNDIVLTAVQGAWLQYDAITLVNDPAVNTADPDIQSVSVEATPFIIRQDGRLRRVLVAKVTPSVPAADLTLHVAAGGEHNETTVRKLATRGGVSQEITVPDSAEPMDVTVTARAGSHSRSTTLQLKPARHWRIFVAASSHTDIGYTDLQPKCVERHNENTDLALDWMEKNPGFKWNLEVAWQAENYLASRTGAQRERFLRFAKEGRLGIQALYCNILTGLNSHEAVCRLTWFAHDLKTRYGIPYRSAMISDVPTQEATVPMLLAGSGIRYFSSGINNDRAYPFRHMQNQCPCWWEGPDGSRVLMMYTPSYAQASGWGLDQSLSTAHDRILGQLKSYEARTDYPYDAVFLHGAVGDNTTFNPRLPQLVREWNEHYASPQIILSHNAEFFEHIEKEYGDKLPVFRGSAGSYWEDGAGSSAAETALCRNAEQSLTTAAQCLALARWAKPETAYPAIALNDAWRNCLLYDEHTWGAHCSISQPDSDFTKDQCKIKAQFAVDADRQAKTLLAQASTSLASLVKTDGRSLVVINSASWPRTDVVQVKLPANTFVADKDVACCEGTQGTLLLVKDVPACGYRVLRLGEKSKQESATPAEGATIESRYYRVTFDPANGAVTSLFDKQLKRELVDASAPYRLNQYLYVAGGKGSRIVMNERGPEPELKITSPEKATLRRVRLSELGERMIVETSGTQTPSLVCEVTVWNDLPRVDVVNRFTKTETYDKEAVYFAFPFAAADPTFRYECPAGIVNPNSDMLPGACLDWFAVQHFVEIESGDAAITWSTPDAPLVCLQDINRGKWLHKLPMKNSHIYAYVMNNYWHTNYKAGQGGEHVFRFSITSRAKADNAASARFGWAASNPLLAVPVESGNGGPLPGKATSLVSIAESNVLLTAAKQAETGDALVLRLWEVSGQSTTAHVRLNHLPVHSATACSLVEDPQGSLKIENNVIAVPIRGSGLATVLVR